MPTVLILGFQYNDLESSITDIYKVYSFYKKLSYRIYVASDIIRPSKPPEITSLLASKSVDEYFVPFIEKEFATVRHLVRSKSEVQSFFRSVSLTSDRRLVVYYTGHGEEGGFRLPDGSRYKALEFRNDLLKIGSSSSAQGLPLHRGIDTSGSQIFLILDCCNPHGLYLPFKLGRESQSFLQVTNHFVVPQIILISSSEPTQKSRADLNESPFTKHLFSQLADPGLSYDIFSLLNFVDKQITDNSKGQQKSTAYSSYTSLKIPWSWVVTNLIDVDVNQNIDSLVVRLKKEK